MHQVCFVILHYLSFETTKNCVDSICNTFAQNAELPYHIVIVDNASPNDSYHLLSKEYQSHLHVTLLKAPANLGFAKGNNLGYEYALNEIHADFIIITNNDTEFQQTEFLKLMTETYEAQHCALIGPDIYNITGYHQNPYRSHPITHRELTRWIRNRRIWLLFLHLDRVLNVTKFIPFFRNYYEKRSAAGRPQPDSWQSPQHNVVLQGACLIFTPAFTQHFTEYAFYPETFMYCEEDILAILCQKHDLGTYYAPNLQVIHMESVSTALSLRSARERDFFFTKNILQSLKVLKKMHSGT